MSATAMSNVEMGTTCGGYTYELEYVSGPLDGTGIDHNSIYTLVETAGAGSALSLTGTPSTREWTGDHTFKIKCTNGHSSNAPAGNSGLYSSVYSNDFTVTILNPCDTTVINSDLSLTIPTLEADIDSTELVSAIFIGTTDSQSLVYGNGYDICGTRSYKILDKDENVYDSAGIFDFEIITSTGAADQMSFTVYNYPGGYEFTDTLYMQVSLPDYGDISTSLVPFEVKYHTCRPDQFSLSNIED